MLGMYVSAHPLDGTDHILSANRDTTIVDLVASGRTKGTDRLSGLITSVQPKMTKQGNNWAIVNLADRDGTIEVLFFPAVYQLVVGALVEDAVVSVQGRINDATGHSPSSARNCRSSMCQPQSAPAPPLYGSRCPTTASTNAQ
ncbi:hypothetical protein GCM10020367_63180 [Streptomyces sannanensis]|uniref:OB domain-containing protein n=1 Tax=Streptomyces sannanensis TaxID=285536 RepID=A0ABP6SLU4_9ACTN